jgi:hypothetical protein
MCRHFTAEPQKITDGDVTLVIAIAGLKFFFQPKIMHGFHKSCNLISSFFIGARPMSI